MKLKIDLLFFLEQFIYLFKGADRSLNASAAWLPECWYDVLFFGQET